MWRIFCKVMDWSKIRAIFGYEFDCETNASEAPRNINT